MQKKVSLTVTLTLISLGIYAQTTVQTVLSLWQNFNQQNVVGFAQNQDNADRAVNAIHFKPQKEITSDWDPFNSVWYFHDSVLNSYNSLGNITQKLQYNGGSTVDYKNIYVYDGNGKIISDSSFYNPGNGFINNTLYTYTYDSNGNKTQQIYFTNWNGSSWTSGNKSDYTYDVNNNRIQSVDQLWNGTAWNNSGKETYTWSSGLLTTGIFQSWDGTTWTNAWKVDYVNVGGQTNGFTGFSWTGSSWQSASKYTNVTWYQWNGFFNEASKLSGYIEQVPNGSLWKDTVKINFSYDSFGNQTEYVRQAKPNSVYITSEGFKNFYQYNGNNSVTEDIQQNWNPVTQLYENYKKRAYSDFYQYTVTSCIPDQPGSISGNTIVNPGDSETYNISPVAGATSYNWNLPAGWSGTSTSNVITVVAGASGTITVSAVNSCGSSIASTLAVIVTNVQATDCSPTLFKDLRPGYSGSYPMNFRELNGTLYFSNYDGLWKTDGTEAGTIQIESFSDLKEIEVLGNNLVFCVPSPNWQLWKSDGTSTTLIKEFPNATNSDGIFNLTQANGFVFFTVNENYVRKLWRTDGTQAGTILVKDIDPTNYASYNPGGYFEFNNNIYFNAGTATSGQELWKSDGTEAGTTIVKDLRPGVGSGHTNYGVYAILNNELYFYANDGVQYGLWKTDGSDAGTTFIKECIWIDEISSINNVIYFSAYDIGANTGNTLYGEELWRSDGTPTGTYMIKDINPGQNGSKHNDYQFKAINSAIVFSAKDGVNGVELWKTDGTEAGTMLLKNINSDIINAQIGLATSKVFNGYLYFSANNGTTGGELWKTDGTEAGTALVADLYSGADGSSPFDFTVFNGTIFFRAESASAGVELWSCVSMASSVADDTELDNTVSVYPNPSNGMLNIELLYATATELTIYNAIGQKVVTSQIQQKHTTIDLNKLMDGFYYVHLKNHNGVTINKLILKK